MQAFFRPEMLNRLDEVLVFRQLGRPQARTHTSRPLFQHPRRIFCTLLQNHSAPALAMCGHLQLADQGALCPQACSKQGLMRTRVHWSCTVF